MLTLNHDLGKISCRMKISSTLTSVALFSAIFFLNFNPTFAKQEGSAATNSAEIEASVSAKLTEVFKTLVDPGALEVGDSLVSPSSPLFFLKALREKVELYFAPNHLVSAQRELEFAVRRLREVKTLIEEDRQDLIEVTLQKYRNHLDKVNKVGGGTEGLRVDLGTSAARHMYVLQSLYYNTNDETAQRAIRTSIERILEYNWLLLENPELTEEEYDQLVQKVALRQLAGCQFLNEESKNTSMNQAEQQALQEYVKDCKAKAAKYFSNQINSIDSN